VRGTALTSTDAELSVVEVLSPVSRVSIPVTPGTGILTWSRTDRGEAAGSGYRVT